MSVAAIYEGWPKVQNHLVARLPNLTSEHLALKASPSGWPLWALISHLAESRVYWLCHVLKEPGVDKTPFADPSGDGWEDDLDHPRSAEELLSAVESTWKIVNLSGALDSGDAQQCVHARCQRHSPAAHTPFRANS